MGGNYQHTADNGSGAWVDDPNQMPRLSLFLSSLASGGGAAFIG